MFKFRLQRVLDLREKREQETATRLSEARSGEEDARFRCNELESARENQVRRAAGLQSVSPTVGQLQNLRFLVERLNDQIDVAYEEADAAQENVTRCMDEFTAAFKERKVIEKLRSRAHDGWLAEENRADRQLMDGIALDGFVRAASANRNGGS